MRGRGLITSSVQRTAANWNSITAKTITSVSWKLGDNLFMPSLSFYLNFDGTSGDPSFRNIVTKIDRLWLFFSKISFFLKLMDGALKSLHVPQAAPPSACPCRAFSKHTSLSVLGFGYTFRILHVNVCARL